MDNNNNLVNEQNENKNEVYTLVLAPFTLPPKINLGKVTLDSSVTRSLTIENCQNFRVQLNISSNDLDNGDLNLSIEKETTVSVAIRWKPTELGQFSYSLVFEVVDSPRLKFIVSAFGSCCAPKKYNSQRKKKGLLFQTKYFESIKPKPLQSAKIKTE